MTAKKGAATKIIIGVLLVVIVCMGGYIFHLTGDEVEQPEPPTSSESEGDISAAEKEEPLSVTAPVEPVEVESTEDIVKTGFTLEPDIVYAVEDAPIWSNFTTDGEQIGTLPCGESEVRLGQGYGEAEGWGRFMMSADEGMVYIENKYLAIEPDSSPALPTDNVDFNENASNSDQKVDEQNKNGDLSTSKPEVNINSGKNNSTSHKNASGNQSKPVNNQSSSTQNGGSQSSGSQSSGSQSSGSHENSDFLKDAMMKDAETGNTVDRIVVESVEVDNNHDYSGITISP